MPLPQTLARPPTVDRPPRALLLVLCGAAFLDSLDISMMTVALPTIGTDLGVATASLQWVLGAYALGYGGFLLLGGRTTDVVGRRRIFLVGLSAFAASSALGAVAVNGAWLVAARFVTGVSAAFTIPAGLSIITTTIPEGPSRHRAVAAYTATAASGFSFGLILGGLLTGLHWRLTFAAPVPIAIALILGARRVVARDEVATRTRSLDVAGATTITAAMVVLIFAVTRAPAAGWATASTITLLAVAATLIGAFVVLESHVAHPLAPPDLLRSTRLVVANLVMATIGSFVAFQFLATLYLQDVLAWSTIPTALAFLPGGVLIALAAPRAGPLIERIGTARTQTIGMAAFVAGYLLFARIGPELTYPVVMLPTMLLLGIGFASAYPATTVAATADVADDDQGVAAALINSSFQLGGALTLAASAAVVAAGLDGSDDRAALLQAIRPAVLTIGAISAVGLALVAAVGTHGSARAR